MELLEKPSDALFGWVFRGHLKETAEEKKNASKYNAMNDQNETNNHLVRVPHFQNEIGDDLQHL